MPETSPGSQRLYFLRVEHAHRRSPVGIFPFHPNPPIRADFEHVPLLCPRLDANKGAINDGLCALKLDAAHRVRANTRAAVWRM